MESHFVKESAGISASSIATDDTGKKSENQMEFFKQNFFAHNLPHYSTDNRHALDRLYLKSKLLF